MTLKHCLTRLNSILQHIEYVYIEIFDFGASFLVSVVL